MKKTTKKIIIGTSVGVPAAIATITIGAVLGKNNKKNQENNNGINQYDELFKKTNDNLSLIVDDDFKNKILSTIKENKLINYSEKNETLLKELNLKVNKQLKFEENEINKAINSVNSNTIKNKLIEQFKNSTTAQARKEIIELTKQTIALEDLIKLGIEDINKLSFLSSKLKEEAIQKLKRSDINTIEQADKIILEAKNADAQIELIELIKSLDYPSRNNSVAVKELIAQMQNIDLEDDISLTKLKELKDNILIIKNEVDETQNLLKKLKDVSEYLVHQFDNTFTIEDFKKLKADIELELIKQDLDKNKQLLDEMVENLPYPDANGNSIADKKDVQAIKDIKEIYKNSDAQKVFEVKNDLKRIESEILNALDKLNKVSDQNKFNFIYNSENTNLYNELRKTNTVSEFISLNQKINEAKERDRRNASILINNLSFLKPNLKNEIITLVNNSDDFLSIQKLVKRAEDEDKRDELLAIITFDDYINDPLFKKQEFASQAQISLDIIYNEINENFIVSDYSTYKQKLLDLKNNINHARNMINEIDANLIIDKQDAKNQLFEILVQKTSMTVIDEITLEVKKQQLKKKAYDLPYPLKNENQITEGIENLFARIINIATQDSFNEINEYIDSLPIKINGLLQEINNINTNQETQNQETEIQKQRLIEELSRSDTIQEFNELKQKIQKLKTQSELEYENKQKEKLKQKALLLKYPDGIIANAISKINAMIDNISVSEVNLWNQKIDNIQALIQNTKEKINTTSSKNHALLLSILNDSVTLEEFNTLNAKITEALENDKQEAIDLINSLNYLLINENGSNSKNHFINLINNLNPVTFLEVSRILEEARLADKKQELIIKAKQLNYPAGANAVAVQELIRQINELNNIQSSSEIIAKFDDITNNINSILTKYNQLENKPQNIIEKFNQAIDSDNFNELNQMIDAALRREFIESKKRRIDSLVEALSYPNLDGSEFVGAKNNAPAIVEIKSLYANNDETMMDNVENDLGRLNNEIRQAKTMISKLSFKNKTSFNDPNTNNSFNLIELLRSANTSDEFRQLFNLINQALAKDKQEAKESIEVLNDLNLSSKNNYKSQINDASNYNEIQRIVNLASVEDKYDSLKKIVDKDSYNRNISENSTLDIRIKETLRLINQSIDNTPYEQIENKRDELNRLNNKIIEVRNLIDNLNQNNILEENHTKAKLYDLLATKFDNNGLLEVELAIQKEKLKKEASLLPYPNQNQASALSDWNNRINLIADLNQLQNTRNEIQNAINQINNLKQEIDNITVQNANSASLNQEELENRKNDLRDELNRSDTTQEFDQLREHIRQAQTQTINAYRQNEKNRLKQRAENLSYPAGLNALAINEIKDLIDNETDDNFNVWNNRLTDIEQRIQINKLAINNLSDSRKTSFLNQLNLVNTDQEFNDLENQVQEVRRNEINEVAVLINALVFLSTENKNNFVRQLNEANYLQMQTILLNAKKANLEARINSLPYPNSNASAKNELLNQSRSINTMQEIDSKLEELNSLNEAINSTLIKINNLPYPDGSNAVGATDFKNILNTLTSISQIQNLVDDNLANRIENYKRVLFSNLNPFPEENKNYGLKSRINSLNTRIEENELMWNLYETKRQIVFVPLINALSNLSSQEKTNFRNRVISIPSSSKTNDFVNFNEQMQRLDDVILEAQKQDAKNKIDLIPYPSNENAQTTKNGLKQLIDQALDLANINILNTKTQALKNKINEINTLISNLTNQTRVNEINNELGNINDINGFSHVELLIKRAQVIQSISQLSNLQPNQINEYADRIDNVTTENEILNIQNEAIFQNEKERIKVIVDNLDYPNNNSTLTTDSRQRLKNLVQSINNQEELTQKETEINSFSTALRNKIQEVNQLPYHSNNAEAKSQILNTFNGTINIQELNNALPSSWRDDLLRYKEAIIRHFGANHALMARLDKTIPTNAGDYGIDALKDNVFLTKKNNTRTGINNLTNLNNQQKQPFLNEINNIVQNFPENLSALNEMDEIFLRAKKQNYFNFVDNLNYPNDSNYQTDVNASRNEIKNQLISVINQDTNITNLESQLNQINLKINEINNKINQLNSQGLKNRYRSKLAQANHNELDAVILELDKIIGIQTKIQQLTNITNANNESDKTNHTNPAIARLRENLSNRLEVINDSQIEEFRILVDRYKVILDDLKTKFAIGDVLVIKGFVDELISSEDLNSLERVANKIQPFYDQLRIWWENDGLGTFLRINQNHIIVYNDKYKSYNDLLHDVWTSTNPDFLIDLNRNKKLLYEGIITFAKINKTNLPQPGISHYQNIILEANTRNQINLIIGEFNDYKNKINESRQELETTGATSNRSEFNNAINNAQNINQINTIKNNIVLFKNSLQEAQEAIVRYQNINNHNPLKLREFEQQKLNVLNKPETDNLILRINEAINELNGQNSQDSFNTQKNNLLEELKSSSSLSSDSKESLSLNIKVIDSEEIFNDNKNKIKTLLAAIQNLNNKKQEASDYFKQSLINGERLYDFHKKLVEVNRVVNNNQLVNVDPSNIDATITVINNFINQIDAMTKRRDNFMPGLDFEQMMRNETTRLFGFEINQEANKFDFNNFLSSGSINLNNAKIYFDHYDNENFDFEIIDLRLEGDSLELLNATIKATFKNETKRSITLNKQLRFDNGVKQNLENIRINNLDELYDIKYNEIRALSLSEWNNLSLNETINLFNQKSNGIGNYFKYEIKIKPTYSSNKLNATVSILFNKQELKTFSLSSVENILFRNESESKATYLDRKNLEEINRFIRTTNPKQTFFSSLEIKDISIPDVHTNFLASQAVEKFNTLYKMPKFGRYEIFVKEAYDIDDYAAKAKFVLWYKIDGQEAPGYNLANQRQYHFAADGFLKQNFYDVRSKSRHFAENDFNSPEFRQPDQNTRNLIETINESNFAWRYAIGKFWGWHNSTNSNYRTLNPVKFMQQEAFLNFEYMIQLTNGIDNKGDDLVNQEIIQLNQTALHNKNIVKNTRDISSIKNNYYRYFYDFRLENKRSLSFRIGYIKKDQQNVRYTSSKRYTLINLVNDYEQALYPEIILNNIKLSDLNINSTEIQKRTISQYASNIGLLNQHIRLRGDSNNKVVYNHFEMNASSYRIIEIKRINATEAYIRFDTARFDSPTKNRFKGDVWYRISGFRSDNNNTAEALSFESRNLTTVFDSQDVIKRTRIIEPYWSDLKWQINKTNNIASWTLAKKYIEKTLLQSNTINREINIKILGNILFNDNERNNRVRNQGFNFKINLDELINQKIIKKEFDTPSLENNQFKYSVIYEWTDEGIVFKVQTQDQSYKIIIDEPEVQTFNNAQKFDKNRAFIILPAATSIEISYTNNQENEDFNIWSNRFDYNEIEYTEFQQPILFSNDLNFLKDRTVYYPNQNVGYKLHEGFKMNIEQMRIRKQLDWDVVRAPFARSMVVDQGNAFGTLSIMGKVNDDPNDYRFYAMTNNHVESVNNFADISGNNFLVQRNGRKYVFAPKTSIFQEAPWNGRRWDQNDMLRNWNIRNTLISKIENVPIKIIWSGSNQISNNGSVTNKSVDLTIFIIDFKNDYLRAKRDGWMDIVWKVENLMKIKGTKLEIDYKNSVISVPHIRDVGNISWPSVRFAGQVIRRFAKDRLSSQDHSFYAHDLIKWQQQHHYVQYFGGGGSSGSGLFLENDIYMATWNAGSTGSNDGFFSQGPKYATRDFNYMGVNFENENPLELKNTRSLGAQIMRANLRNPNEFDLPWFLKPIKNEN